MNHLVANGIDPRRIRLSQSGANEPNAQASTAGQARQSRVEIYVLNEVISGPSDGDKAKTKGKARNAPKAPKPPKAEPKSE